MNSTESTFPYQIDKIVSNSNCLNFIRAFIDYEELGKVDSHIKWAESHPDINSKLNAKGRILARSRREFNLNFGIYRPEKKSNGVVVKPAEVVGFYKLSDRKQPELVPLEENGTPNKGEINPGNDRHRSSSLSPSRWSMRTANYTKDRSGLVIIIPNNITMRSRQVKVYCGYKYGLMMGHGSLQIWKRNDFGWAYSSSKGTWVS